MFFVSGSVQAPLARLMLFLVSLALFGSLIAGTHYVAVDLPAQQAGPVPMNYIPNDPSACARCMSLCAVQPWDNSCPNNCMRCDCNQWECADR